MYILVFRFLLSVFPYKMQFTKLTNNRYSRYLYFNAKLNLDRPMARSHVIPTHQLLPSRSVYLDNLIIL